MSTVWLASYPKSGNTWIRFMLYSVLYGPPKRSEDVPSKIPDIHRPMPFDKPESGPVYVKSHLELTAKHPRLDDTSRAIHIIRNPRDVMLSAINYRTLTDENPKGFPKEQFIRSYLESGGDRHWQAMGFGTWASHARSWRNTERFPVLKLRYEDLKTDPRAQLVRMLEFLGVECSESKIKEAVIASSFDSMRALEIREKKSGKPSDLSKHLFVGTQGATRKGVYFMNKGKSNQSLDVLMSGLDERFNDRFKDELAEFGY